MRRGPAGNSGGAPPRVEKPQFKRTRLNWGGGARGGSRPPRVESNAPEALLCKASGERSGDFCAAVRRESNGIFAGCRKSPGTFSTACGPPPELPAGPQAQINFLHSLKKRTPGVCPGSAFCLLQRKGERGISPRRQPSRCRWSWRWKRQQCSRPRQPRPPGRCCRPRCRKRQSGWRRRPR